MKKKFLITGAAISLSALLGVGAVSGILNAKEPVKAEAATYSGSIIIKKDDDTLKSRTKLVGYLFNGSTNTWGTAVANNGDTYQTYSWSVGFEPTGIIILNVEDNWSSSWDNPWWSPKCRTGNIDLSTSDVVWMKSNASESSNWGTYNLETYVKGGASASWSVQTVNTQLNNVKCDGSKIEVYGSVTLPANTHFKVVQTGNETEVWCGNYTSLSQISSNLSTDEKGNIVNTVAATYEFYFNYDGQTTYITDPVIAAADEWAQDFYKHVGCDPTGVNAPTNWSTFVTSYAALDGEVKDLIYAADAVEDGGTFVEYAMWQYDWAVAHHDGLTKFVTNSSGTVRAVNTSLAVNHYSLFTPDSTTTIALITIVAVTSITAIGAIVFLRVRKHQ